MLNIKQIIAIILLLSPLTFWAQGRGLIKTKLNGQPVTRVKPYLEDEKKPRDYFYLTATVGANILNGDNARNFKVGYQGNLSLGYQIHEFVGVEGRIGYATFSGNFYNITSHFVNSLEANFNIMLNLTNILFGYNRDRKIDVIPHIGIGQVQTRGRVVYQSGKEVSYGYENYTEHNTHLIDGLIDGRWKPYGGGIGGRLVSGTVPMGVLFSYKINDYIKLHLDIVSNWVDSDRFDAVPSGYHYDWFTTFNFRAQCKLKKYRKAHNPCDNLFNNYKNNRHKNKKK